MTAKFSDFIYRDNKEFFDNYIRHVIDGTTKQVPLEYRFIFCNGTISYDDAGASNDACHQLLEYQKVVYVDDVPSKQKVATVTYKCKNCRYIARLKNIAHQSHQKWNDEPDRTITFYERDVFLNEAKVFQIPQGPVYGVREVVSGASCFYETVLLTGNDKARYYLRGLVPDKLLKTT